PGAPRRARPGRGGRWAEPTRVTSQPTANSRISARVYSRFTVASVPRTDTSLVVEAAQAGLMAGTVPTNGTGKGARRAGRITGEAGFGGTKTGAGFVRAVRGSITPLARAAGARSSMAP